MCWRCTWEYWTKLITQQVFQYAKCFHAYAGQIYIWKCGSILASLHSFTKTAVNNTWDTVETLLSYQKYFAVSLCRIDMNASHAYQPIANICFACKLTPTRFGVLGHAAVPDSSFTFIIMEVNREEIRQNAQWRPKLSHTPFVLVVIK